MLVCPASQAYAHSVAAVCLKWAHFIIFSLKRRVEYFPNIFWTSVCIISLTKIIFNDMVVHVQENI